MDVYDQCTLTAKLRFSFFRSAFLVFHLPDQLSWFSGFQLFLLFCFSAFQLFSCSPFQLLCFSASLLFYFSAFPLFAFFAFPPFSFSAFQLLSHEMALARNPSVSQPSQLLKSVTYLLVLCLHYLEN